MPGQPAIYGRTVGGTDPLSNIPMAGEGRKEAGRKGFGLRTGSTAFHAIRVAAGYVHSRWHLGYSKYAHVLGAVRRETRAIDEQSVYVLGS